MALRLACAERECNGSEFLAVSTLLLVDGHAYAYRAFHAIRSLHAPDGRPTNALFGFIKMVDKARLKVQPTHLAVVWDGGLDAERMERLPAYKAQRPEMPEALGPQLDAMAEYLGAAGVASFCQDGVEADDLIGTLASRAAAREWQVVIASSDKDFMQLVSGTVKLLNPADKEPELRGEEFVRAKTGLEPRQVVDWLSLIGDAVDNIPGVVGVGPKTATRLLQQHGSVEALYANLGAVESERLRAALQAAQADVVRNGGMIRLKIDLATAPSLDQCAPAPADGERLRTLFTGWGFRSLAASVAARELLQGELI
jgi:DNA polymerase-1